MQDNDDLIKIYGNLRWHNDIQIFKFSKENFTAIFSGKDKSENDAKIRPNIRAIFNTTIIFGEMENVGDFDFSKRIGGSITLSYNPKYLEDVRIFAQYYYGQDYYNIHFENTLSEFRIGLMTDSFGI
jgi:hypothetical protein